MSFISLSFLAFVTICALVYFIVPKKIRWWVLLAGSFAFYPLSSPKTFVFLLITITTSFFGAKILSKQNLEYKAQMSVRSTLLQFIDDGTGIMVYTCDANINIQLLRAVFDIPPRFISILDNEGSRIYDSVTYKVTESAEALIATDGSLKALSDAVRASVVLKDTEGVSMMIQGICFAMGFIFVAGLSCISPYAIDSMEILIMQAVFLLLSTVSILKAM